MSNATNDNQVVFSKEEELILLELKQYIKKLHHEQIQYIHQRLVRFENNLLQEIHSTVEKTISAELEKGLQKVMDLAQSQLSQLLLDRIDYIKKELKSLDERVTKTKVSAQSKEKIIPPWRKALLAVTLIATAAGSFYGTQVLLTWLFPSFFGEAFYSATYLSQEEDPFSQVLEPK